LGEEGLEDVGRVGGAGGWGEGASAGEAEEGGGELHLVGEGVVGGLGVAFDEVHGLVEEAVVAVGGGGVAVVALAIEFGDEGGVVVAPVADGLAGEVEGGGDVGVGVAGEDEGDGGELAGGEGAGCAK
jgi:hypothetical protein